MRVLMLMLMFVTACAVESGADGSLAVEQAISVGDIDAVRGLEALTGGGAITNDEGCPPLDRCPPGQMCCWTRQQAVCCIDSFYEPAPDGGSVLNRYCTCRPLPHTDPGHGIPQEPFAPAEGGS